MDICTGHIDGAQIGNSLAEPDGQRLKRQRPEVLSLPGNPKETLKLGEAGRLLQAVDFPQFASGLIQGVFHSIIHTSIEQMSAYVMLLAAVSKSMNEFRDENTADSAKISSNPGPGGP